MCASCKQKSVNAFSNALKIFGAWRSLPRERRKESALAEKRVKLLHAFPIVLYGVFAILDSPALALLFLGLFHQKDLEKEVFNQIVSANLEFLF